MHQRINRETLSASFEEVPSALETGTPSLCVFITAMPTGLHHHEGPAVHKPRKLVLNSKCSQFEAPILQTIMHVLNYWVVPLI